MVDFKVRLKEALKYRNMKAIDLARQMKVGRSTISQWMSGKYNVNNEKINRIAKTLNVDPVWLFGANVPFKEFKENGKEQDDIMSKFYKLSDDNKLNVEGFIEGLLYNQEHKK